MAVGSAMNDAALHVCTYIYTLELLCAMSSVYGYIYIYIYICMSSGYAHWTQQYNWACTGHSNITIYP